LTDTIPKRVIPAVISAGLPETSIVNYLTALTSGSSTALAAVKCLTPIIAAAGTRAYRFANTDAYRTVFLTSIPFGVIAIRLTFFIPNVDKLMTLDVATTLHERGVDELTRAEHEKKIKAEL
jgi:hypothetical protein